MSPASQWNDGGGGGGFALPSLTPGVKWLLLLNGGIWIFANLLMFLVLPQVTFTAFERGMAAWFGLDPGSWTWWFPRVWQLLTYGFLHAPDLSHVLFNMLGLFFFGTMLEGILGTRKFLSFYGMAVALGGAAALAYGWLTGDMTPTVGASGGVLAVIVAMAVLRPHTRVIFIMFPIALWVLAVGVVFMDVMRVVYTIKGVSGDMVSWQVHLTGAAFGFLAAKKGWMWRDLLSDYEGLKERRAEKKAADDDKRMDEILAKIGREGMHSLTSAEKAFLNKASKRKSG